MFCSSQWTMLSIARCNADRRRLACPGRRLLGQSWPQDYAPTHLQSLPRRATLIMHTPSPVIDCDLLLCIVHRRPHAMASGSRSRTVSQTVPSAQYHIGQEVRLASYSTPGTSVQAPPTWTLTIRHHASQARSGTHSHSWYAREQQRVLTRCLSRGHRPFDRARKRLLQTCCAYIGAHCAPCY